MKRLLRLMFPVVALLGCQKAPHQKTGARELPDEPLTGSECTASDPINFGRAMVRLETDIPEPWSPDSHVEITGIPNLLPEPQESPTLLVPEKTKLLSRGKKVTSSSDDPIFGNLDQITDGKKTLDHGFFLVEPGSHWVQIDLGQSVLVDAVWVWHDFFPARSYYDVVIRVSEDPEFKIGVTTVYNNDCDNSSKLGLGRDRPYVESRFGLLVDGRGVRGRYVRLYSRGNTWSDLNGYTEVEVFGREIEN